MDKPAGITSHDVVARVRRALGTRAVGHTGTLDPFATGLMIVVVGKATRLARFLESLPKRYRARARLGVRTDTEDSSGRVIAERQPAVWPERREIEAVLMDLTGTIRQVPPAWSAKRIAGQRSHDLARRGVVVELPAVDVTIYRLEVERYEPPVLEFVAEVGRGTYIRALARDLGEALGVGASLTALRRETTGPWGVSEAAALESVSAETRLLSPSQLLAHLPAVEVSDEEAVDVSHGRLVRRDGTSGLARLEKTGSLVAVGEARAEGWHPVVVLEGR